MTCSALASIHAINLYHMDCKTDGRSSPSCGTIFGYLPVYCQGALLPDADLPISLDDMTEQDLRDFLRQHRLQQPGDEGAAIPQGIFPLQAI